MGNCLSGPKPKKEIVIGTFGLDNAGKTTILKVLKGDAPAEVTPTVGFTTVAFESKRFRITLYDLGGGARIRDIWKNYFPEVYGIIFVVDASDRERIEEVRQTFSSLAQHSKIQEKPMLFLLNKQDAEVALDEVDAKDDLNIGASVNKYRSPCRVETCVGTKGTGKNADRGIKDGFQWLLDQIYDNYDKLNNRIQRDVKEARQMQEIENAERRERVQRIREEREREEQQMEDAQDQTQGVLNGHLDTTGGKNRMLPFEPMPRISEEISSQRSEISPKNRKKSGSSSRHTPDYLVTKADVVSENSLLAAPMSTGLGASESSVPHLPPISPKLVRPLPPPPENSSPPVNSRFAKQWKSSQVPPGTGFYENKAYESETAVTENARKISNSDDMTQLSDITDKRKRKRKRLQRFQKVGASDESDDTSQTNGGIKIDLASLPSSEPRPSTPLITTDEENEYSADRRKDKLDSTTL